MCRNFPLPSSRRASQKPKGEPSGDQDQYAEEQETYPKISKSMIRRYDIVTGRTASSTWVILPTLLSRRPHASRSHPFVNR